MSATVADGQICIVDDGQSRWGAKWGELRAALERRGWQRNGSAWSEPAEYSESDEVNHYVALCQDVRPEPGYGPEDDFTVENCRWLIWWPSDDVWLAVKDGG